MDKDTKALLEQPLDRKHVSQRQQGGISLSYIEGHHVIREANRIFGFDGWELHVQSLESQNCGTNEKGNHIVSAQALVSIAALGCNREDVGYGSGISKSLADAYESAGKEAVTDAMKRALRTFGDQFGNALYDKQQKHVADEQPDKDVLQSIDCARTIDELKGVWEVECKKNQIYTPFINNRKAELS